MSKENNTRNVVQGSIVAHGPLVFIITITGFVHSKNFSPMFLQAYLAH